MVEYKFKVNRISMKTKKYSVERVYRYHTVQINDVKINIHIIGNDVKINKYLIHHSNYQHIQIISYKGI